MNFLASSFLFIFYKLTRIFIFPPEYFIFLTAGRRHLVSLVNSRQKGLTIPCPPPPQVKTKVVCHLHFKIYFKFLQMLLIVLLWIFVSASVGSFHIFQCFHRHCSEFLRHTVWSFQPDAFQMERVVAKVMWPIGGRAKSVMQGSFLPGKSSILKTTCCSCPVRTWVMMCFSKWWLC